MNEFLTKGFWMAVIAGVVVVAMTKTWGQSGAISGTKNPNNTSGKNAGAFGPQLGFATMAGETKAVPVFIPIAVPSGHGDATLNAGIGNGILPGNCASVSDLVYEPAFNTNCDTSCWVGVGPHSARVV